MRRASHDVGWLTNEDGQVMGFSLGFDFCAEHEFGAQAIKAALGIPPRKVPVGVEDRTMTQVPPCMGFVTYDQKSIDKRLKKVAPAAILWVRTDSYGAEQSLSAEELVQRFDLRHYLDFAAKRDADSYRPERDDIASAWSSHSGFAIHVRGQENVALLTQLHDALQALDVSLADPTLFGFKRTAMSLVQNAKLSQALRDEVRENDLAHLRLQRAAEDSGVAALLKAAGKGWYALSPAWRAGEGSELLFYLNPAQQHRYSSGWFTVEELRQWARDEGPVAQHQQVNRALALDADWSIYLLRGLGEAGMHLRMHEKFVWLDPEKTQPGISMHFSKPGVLTDGLYPLAAVEAYVERGKALTAEPSTAS